MNNGSEPPKRHWHGTVGDRYEQLNVWVRGGAIQTLPGRRPSTDVNDRHDSTSSESSTSSAHGASPPRNGSGERRRSSTGLFEGLTSTKRNATDPSVAARRQSWLEQSEQGGYLSKLWNTYTRGR
ncbi:hypothetical protein CNMCM8980_007277 [Aspergillus fumigatiaffinis]|uniref:Uncharacterized protein n=1 Tax=Aspergillus fumigatiaffinis TaxID=340414 RepID=A0A8H4M4K3_9EURO|nr:hypothetical protein CNMCM5878_006913 [Aspergillus fumigatiaffinis]KAF4229214.1 hypothetical protein CNMCM6457_006560 [Aspergillus fumigatiaffinis]KAF4237143.1 hypothetical protein CNMCM6805_007092 [Aspergillus fumigatiaffinis]KAF4247505.1 hypothetical protein CNMCM8980_007277 [Aspergillus fumigatiaffinis]